MECFVRGLEPCSVFGEAFHVPKKDMLLLAINKFHNRVFYFPLTMLSKSIVLLHILQIPGPNYSLRIQVPIISYNFATSSSGNLGLLSH